METKKRLLERAFRDFKNNPTALNFRALNKLMLEYQNEMFKAE